MTHVLIAADFSTVGIIFFLVIVGLMILAALSSGQIVPLRRTYRRGFWHKDELSHPMYGTGLLDQLHDTTNQTSPDSQNDLSIYQAHDNASDSTSSDSSGSILGLDGGTPSGSLEHSDGYGDLGSSAGDYLNDSGSSLSDNSSGGSFSSDN